MNMKNYITTKLESDSSLTVKVPNKWHNEAMNLIEKASKGPGYFINYIEDEDNDNEFKCINQPAVLRAVKGVLSAFGNPQDLPKLRDQLYLKVAIYGAQQMRKEGNKTALKLEDDLNDVFQRLTNNHKI